VQESWQYKKRLREPSSFMVDYGYKNQRETLKTYEDLYFGSCLVWEKNELFFKEHQMVKAFKLSSDTKL